VVSGQEAQWVARAHTYMYVCMYVHTHTHTHIYIYIYIYVGRGLGARGAVGRAKVHREPTPNRQSQV